MQKMKFEIITPEMWKDRKKEEDKKKRRGGEEEKKKRKKAYKDWKYRKKAKALIIYGKRCQECGESDIRILEWHHISGKNGETTRDVERKIVKEGRILDNVQLLCANHHRLADRRDKTTSFLPVGTILYIIDYMEGKR